MREHRNLRHGRARAHNGKERTRLRRSARRFQLEQLETRVLLFAPEIAASLHLLTLSDLAPAAVVSFPAPGLPSVVAPASSSYAAPAVVLSLPGQGGQTETTAFSTVQQLTTVTPGLFLVDQSGSAGAPVTEPQREGFWRSASPQESGDFPVTTTHDSAVSPLAAMPGASEPETGAEFNIAIAGAAGYGHPYLSDNFAFPSGLGMDQSGPDPMAPNADDASSGMMMMQGASRVAPGDALCR